MSRPAGRLAVFTATVLGVGFIGRGVDLAAGVEGPDTPGLLLWIITPAIAALLFRAFGDGWADAGLAPRFRANAVWYVVAILIYPALTALTLGIGALAGVVSMPGLSAGPLGTILLAFARDAGPQFVKNIFEESAWRGYLAPLVFRLGLGAWAGHMLVGLIWGAWHIPYYLYFLEPEVLAQFTALSPAAFIPVSIAVMVAWAIVYGELWLLTGSIWPAVVMHMVEDAFLNQLFIDGHVELAPGADLVVSPVHGIVSVALFLAAGATLRRCRMRQTA